MPKECEIKLFSYNVLLKHIMDDNEVDNNNNNSLVSEPEGDHDETPNEEIVMVVRRTKDDHE